MLLKKDESGRKSRKVDELAGFELLILTGIISLILAGNYIAGYNITCQEVLFLVLGYKPYNLKLSID